MLTGVPSKKKLVCRIHKYIDYFGIELGTYFFSKDVFLWVLFKTNKGKIAHSGLGLKNGRVRKCEADSSHEWLLTPWPQKLHFCSQTSLLVCSSSSAHWAEIANNCSKIPCQRLFHSLAKWAWPGHRNTTF